MSISVACPNCEVPYSVGDRWAGKRVKCKRCGSAIVVPPASSFGPPSRMSPQRGRRRRKVRLPIGLVLAAGGMIAVLLIGIVVATNVNWDQALNLVGMSKEERFARRNSAVLEQMVDALEEVTDEPSAQRAALKIRTCGGEFATIVREMNEWQKELIDARNSMSKEEVDAKLKELERVAAKYEPAAQENLVRFEAEFERISKIEGAGPVIMEALSSFNHSASIAKMGSPMLRLAGSTPQQLTQSSSPSVTSFSNPQQMSGWRTFAEQGRANANRLRERQAALSPDQKVTFILEGAKMSGQDVVELSNRLRQITGAKESSGMTEGTAYVVVLSPVTTDIEVFKTQIDFGEVIALDLEKRTITIQLAEKVDGINRKRKS